jgi:peptidoglycan/xylan/chitin deacetylase (PgdA/CDA1 family)
MLHHVKLGAFRLARHTGLFNLVGDNSWRRQRLAILCYHGVSLDDEHLWHPSLYVSPRHFRARMEHLRRRQCNVLPLAEALARLAHNDLPPRAVAITFDDGFYDYLAGAHPVLRDYGYPATLYLTTYYCFHNLPIFRLMCSYLLWKRPGATITVESWDGTPLTLETASPPQREAALTLLDREAARCHASALAKQSMLERIAAALQLDLAALSARRILHLLTPAEARWLHAEGCDLQLHTHRHRTPRDCAAFQREIVDNRAALAEITGNPSPAEHFCYPSGNYAPEFLPWLRELGVKSATTCVAGLASSRSNPLLLPRYLDASYVSEVEFDAWITGADQLLRGHLA